MVPSTEQGYKIQYLLPIGFVYFQVHGQTFSYHFSFKDTYMQYKTPKQKQGEKTYANDILSKFFDNLIIIIIVLK